MASSDSWRACDKGAHVAGALAGTSERLAASPETADTKVLKDADARVKSSNVEDHHETAPVVSPR